MANVSRISSEGHIPLSESFDESSSQSVLLKRRRPSPRAVSSVKKTRSNPSNSLRPKKMHQFWTNLYKEKFLFQNRLIVPDRIINLSQLKDASCNVSHFFKFQDLSLLFRLCGLLVYTFSV